jgi:hypothetical protein
MTRSVKQIAEHYQVSQHVVLQWIKGGDLNAVNVGRSAGAKPRWRIPEASMVRFEELRSSGSALRTKTESKRRKMRGDSTIEFY